MHRMSGGGPAAAAPGGVRLTLRVQPRASRTEPAGVHGNAFKIRIAAPPVDGAANEALVRFLAERFGVPRSDVLLHAGAGGRLKVVEVRGRTVADAYARLG
jgi:uncharacterized protein (TIGR00251 family)